MNKFFKWSKENLFYNPLSSIGTVLFGYLFLKWGYSLFNWLIINSVWSGGVKECRAAEGACLSFLREKFGFILFGFYPTDLIYRPIIIIVLFVALIFYTKNIKERGKKLLILWPSLGVLMVILLGGGVFGLSKVDSSQWAGLPLTLFLSTIGILFSYPLGIILALGRRSEMPILKLLSILFIEIIRGIPLISVLFMSSVVFPLFLPESVVIPKIIRAQVAIIAFVSAYMAEVVRGGLQSIDKGQYEAADSLALSYWQTMRLVILPQALKVVIPPTVNTAIGMFKDTSLVIIIALFDLMYTTKSSMQDSKWLGFSIEAYLFVAVIYFIFCRMLSYVSGNIEQELKNEERG